MNILNKRLFLISLIFFTAALTGCASTFSSKISTVNQLPASFTDKTYVLAEHPDQSAEPEYRHASEDVKARLQELGFTEVAKEKAALKIAIQLVSVPGNIHVSAPFGPAGYIVTPSGMVIPLGGFNSFGYYPSFIRSPYRNYPRSVFYPRYFSPFYSAFPYGRRFDPFFDPELNVRQYFDHGIELAISEIATGKLLYSVKARTNQNNSEIDPYIALLVETALREFPNKTGESNIDIQLEK